MANTIKLKQGSGSDPSARDLALGEPAVRTDTGEIFLKKDDGTIQKVAGTDDGDKGDIVVSNSGATFTIDNGAVSSAKLAAAISITTSLTSPKILGSNGILEVKAEISSSHTLTSGYNAIAVDPTIANGVTVTVPSGATWSIV